MSESAANSTDGAYTSTVVAPAQIGLGVVSGIVAAAILLAFSSGLWPFAVLALLLAIGLGIYLAVVGLAVEPGRVTVGQGRGEREQRVVYASELFSAEARTLTWPQCFGIGMPEADRSTRLSVRPGPALVLLTRDDELIVVSTPDAERALHVLTGGRTIGPAPAAPRSTDPRLVLELPVVELPAAETPAAGTPPAATSRPRSPRASSPPNPTSPRPRPKPRTGDEG